jgi:hypothetical protein
MLAYYGTRISDNMTKTPEGYLICHNVPLARTGWYEYARSELNLDGEGMIKVYRSPEEVFNPLSIASFEGKTAVDGHPSVYPLNVDNEVSYNKGHVQNVRRGTGEYENCIIGDLFVKDPVLINKIENGVREVSCGYNCEWTPQEDGTILQQHIRGNHVAIVPSGRAGDGVAIRDAANGTATKQKERPMKFDLKQILGLGLKEFARDAEPEAVAAAFEAAKKSEAAAKDELPPGTEGDNPVLAALQQIQATLQQLVAAGGKKELPPEDALDAFEKELAGEKPDEERPAEDELSGEVPTLSEEDKPTNPIGDRIGATPPRGMAPQSVDSKQAVLAGIRTMKPIIASIKDETIRKQATDALVKSFRDMVGPGSQKASYGDLLRTKKAEDKKAQDKAAADEEYGRKLKEQYHRKSITGGR